MTENGCVVCARGKLRRSERRGILERIVYSLFGYYPWRCTYCRRRTFFRDRGQGRFYVTPGEGDSQQRSSSHRSRHAA